MTPALAAILSFYISYQDFIDNLSWFVEALPPAISDLLSQRAALTQGCWLLKVQAQDERWLDFTEDTYAAKCPARQALTAKSAPSIPSNPKCAEAHFQIQIVIV